MIPAGILSQYTDDAMIIEVRVTPDGVANRASVYFKGTVNVEIDWGDGIIEQRTSGATINHQYASSGTYFIKISGELGGFGLPTGLDKNRIYGIHSWGNLGLTDLSYACQQMINLQKIAPIPSTVTNTSSMFNNNNTFNQDISKWDVGNVTNMSAMFAAAAAFNQDISKWDVSSVTDMSNMFNGCTSFNQDLSGWCVANIPTQPVNFSLNTPSWILPKPVWGTCP